MSSRERERESESVGEGESMWKVATMEGEGEGEGEMWKATTMEEGEQVMEAGEMIDLIDGAIHTDGEELSDDQVLDYIEQLLRKREVK